MKSILVISSSDVAFGRRLKAGCQSRGVDCRVVSPADMAVILEVGNLRLFVGGKQVVPDRILPFVRMAGDFTHFVSFLYLCGQQWGWDLNDKFRLQSDIRGKKAGELWDCYLYRLPFPKSMVLTPRAIWRMQSLIGREFGYPLVLKGYGSKGMSVHKIQAFEEFADLYLDDRVVYLIQEFINIDYDIRVLVYDGRVLGGVKRSSDQFLHNFSQGARIEAYTLNPLEKRLALRIAQVNRVTLAGVDLIYKNGEPIILEINHSPQIKGFELVHAVDVVEQVVLDLIQKV